MVPVTCYGDIHSVQLTLITVNMVIDCQVKHWKRVHKIMCDDLKTMYALFHSDMKTTDEAFADPEAHEKKCGVPPSASDFEIVGRAPLYALKNGTKQLMKQGSALDDIKGPSMAYFYSNLAQVVNDGFWMLSRSKTKLTPKKCTKQPDSFFAIALALMYDYSSLAGQGQAILKFREKVEEECPASITMSPNEWLYNYDDGERCSDAQEEAGYIQMVRKRVKVGFNKVLRDNFSSEEVVELWSQKRAIEHDLAKLNFGES